MLHVVGVAILAATIGQMAATIALHVERKSHAVVAARYIAVIAATLLAFWGTF